MKVKNKVLAIALASLMGGMAIQSAYADTAEATCEVRKDGDTQRGKSGPCTFSQRQGFIDIDLKNGETLSLSPGNSAEQYRDQRGNKVHRVRAGSHSQEFKWEGGKHVIVTFLGSNHGNNYNDNPEHQGGHGGHRIEDIGIGNFEILWKNGCIADYDARGRSTGYTQCNDEMKRRSDEIARERSR
jgi:hypothetical protein